MKAMDKPGDWNNQLPKALIDEWTYYETKVVQLESSSGQAVKSV